MITITRTDSTNPDFIELVKQLDAHLEEKNGIDHSFYAQFNKIDQIKHVVIAYENNTAVACGAIKEYAPQIMEVKRMFTSPENRGQGIARKVLTELEKWATELSFHTCILETGKNRPEAVTLYRKSGYHEIPNYGQYAEMEESICFEKTIK